MTTVPFAFGGGTLGVVYPPVDPGPLLALESPEEVSEVPAVFCPAEYVFAVESLNLTGSIELSFDDEFVITDFNIGPINPLKPKLTRIDSKLVSKDLFRRLLDAAVEAGRTRATWYPPESQIPDSRGSYAIAGPQGFLKHIPEPPSGGRGKSRKIVDATGTRHERVWNDPEEIRHTVRLMEAAEAAFRSPHDISEKVDLSTKAKREQWVADSLGIWSVGTVHVQLAIARKNGWIKSGRSKK